MNRQTQWDSFDAAAARIADARQGGDPAERRRAWEAFYVDHLKPDMDARLRVYGQLLRAGVDRMDVETEVLLRLERSFERGNQVLYRYMRKVYAAVCSDLMAAAARSAELVEQSRQLRGGPEPLEEPARRMREDLEAAIDEMRGYGRWAARVRVLEYMLETGETQLAEIARELGMSDGSVRSALHYAFEWLRTTHPQLHQHLVDPELPHEHQHDHDNAPGVQEATT